MPRIVCIGSGHGLIQIAKAMSKVGLNATYIVSVFDDGLSTGILRQIANIPAIGDIRKVLETLSSSEIIEIFEHKISQLYDQKTGNILLLAYIQKYGFIEGILRLQKILGIQKDRIIPVSTDNSFLVAITEKGNIVRKAERKIEEGINEKIIDINLDPPAKISNEAKKEIESADYIFIGPGSFFGSVMVHFAVNGFIEALEKSKAKIYFILNISKDPELIGYNTAQDLIDYVLSKTNRIDYFVINKNITHPLHIKPDTQISNAIFWDLSDKEVNRHNVGKLASLIEFILR